MSSTIPITFHDRRTESANHDEGLPEQRRSPNRNGITGRIGLAVVVAVVAAIVVWQSQSDDGSHLDVSSTSTYTPVDPYHELDRALTAKPVVGSTYTPVDPYRQVKTALATESAYTPADPYHEVAIALAD